MTYRLVDLVFQSDRYFLLFDDLDALKICESNESWRIIADDEFIQKINDCKLSKIINVTDKIVLESKTNLSQLEYNFRKKRLVILTNQY